MSLENGAPKTWLVTGAAGFIGSHLLERLLMLDQRVVAIDNFATGKPENLEAVKKLVGDKRWSQCSFFEQDIRDREGLESLVQQHRPEIVLHQAALGSVPRSIADPLTSHQVNVDGFVNMLEAVRKGGVKRFVYASSSSVYGDIQASPKVEDAIGNCLSPYAATKRINEIYAQVFGRTYGLETVGLRYFNVYGPRQDPDSPYSAVIPLFVSRILSGEKPSIYGDGLQSRDFTYVSNVVHGNLLASERPNIGGRVFNIADGGQTTLLQLLKLLGGLLGKSIEPDFLPARLGDVRESLADITLARKLLGYEPQVRLEEGLKRTISYYREIVSK